MPIVNYEQYRNMLEHAYQNHYAFPAFNVSSIETANAVLEGLTKAKSDGIIQVSVGGGAFASGLDINDSAVGATTLANHVQLVADKYPVYVALHTDHCKPEKLDSFVLPLIEETERRRAKGLPNLFNSHMFDGSSLPLKENLRIAKELLARCVKDEIILEIEAGVVGGEEDGENNSNVPNQKLYTTPEDMVEVYEELSKIGGEYMLAATFGNVHGVYKPGNVKLNPRILHDGQEAVEKAFGAGTHFHLVFHGGSGSEKEKITEALGYGVVKMNVDTDTQYAFTRPVAEHMFRNYDGVLKIDGEVGDKSKYDPRSYLKAAEKGMARRVVEACNDLQSSGKTLYRG